MAKPLNEFGGWLIFFQLGCRLEAVVSFLSVLAGSIGLYLFLKSFKLDLASVTGITVVVSAVLFKLYLSITGSLQKQSQNTPNMIVTKLSGIVAINILIGVASFAFF